MPDNMYGKSGNGRKHIGEGASAETKFKSNTNLGMTGGVVPFQTQHGHSKPNAPPRSGDAKSHSS